MMTKNEAAITPKEVKVIMLFDNAGGHYQTQLLHSLPRTIGLTMCHGL